MFMIVHGNYKAGENDFTTIAGTVKGKH